MEESVESTSISPRACVACRKGKRGCDKALPSCSLCLRTGRECDYSEILSPADEVSQLRARVRELEDQIASPSHIISSATPPITTTGANGVTHNEFLQLSLLDSEILTYRTIVTDLVNVAVPPSVLELLVNLQDVHELISEYLSSVHTWIPIISKRTFGQLLEITHLSLPAATALLILAMHLVLERPTTLPSKHSRLYQVTKQFSHMLDDAGVFSVVKLQAKTLIAIHELGQAMLPAAYLTIGDCARQGIAMGIHDKSAFQLLQQPRTWIDWEERQRLWWLIVILDRYISVGSTNRPLCTADPTKDTCIPSNDDAWNQGEMVPPERVYLSSSAGPASPFARLAQASHLLGRVIRHVDDEPLDPQSTLNEIRLLSDTIFSLLHLIRADSRRGEGYWAARSICLSALLKLSDSHSCDSFPEVKIFEMSAASTMKECTDISLRIMKEVATEIVSLVQLMDRHAQANGVGGLSPLELHCVYRAALIISWMGHNTGDEGYMVDKSICTRWLEKMKRRWQTAGSYLEAIQVLEAALQQGDV